MVDVVVGVWMLLLECGCCCWSVDDDVGVWMLLAVDVVVCSGCCGL